MNKIDKLIFKMYYSKLVETNGSNIFMTMKEAVHLAADLNIDKESAEEAIEILSDSGYFKFTDDLSGGSIESTHGGLEQYLSNYYTEYSHFYTEVCKAIAEDKIMNSNEIAKIKNMPSIVTEHILSKLAYEQYIEIAKTFSGIDIIGVRAHFKRDYREHRV